VEDEELVPLMNMGFTDLESRVALRACGKDLNRAITYALNKREQKQEKEEEERRRQKERKQQLKYGKTSKGKLVSLEALNGLKEMGFQEDLIVEALRQTDNDVQQTLTLLAESREMLQMSINARSRKSHSRKPVVDQQQVNELVGMGFSESLAKGTLETTQGDLQAALDLILAGNGVEQSLDSMGTSPNTPPVPSQEQPKRDEATENSSVGTEMNTNDGTSSLTSSTQSNLGDSVGESALEEEEQQDQKAVDELLEDVPEDEQQYIDYSLVEENEILQKYKALLLSCNTLV